MHYVPDIQKIDMFKIWGHSGANFDIKENIFYDAQSCFHDINICNHILHGMECYITKCGEQTQS